MKGHILVSTDDVNRNGPPSSESINDVVYIGKLGQLTVADLQQSVAGIDMCPASR